MRVSACAHCAVRDVAIAQVFDHASINERERERREKREERKEIISFQDTSRATRTPFKTSLPDEVLQDLFRAAASGDEKEVTKLLAQESSLLDVANAKAASNSAAGRSQKGSNYSALAWAARQGHRNLVVQILAKYPDLISIHQAAKGGYDEVLNIVPLSSLAPSVLLTLVFVSECSQSQCIDRSSNRRP